MAAEAEPAERRQGYRRQDGRSVAEDVAYLRGQFDEFKGTVTKLVNHVQHIDDCIDTRLGAAATAAAGAHEAVTQLSKDFVPVLNDFLLRKAKAESRKRLVFRARHWVWGILTVGIGGAFANLVWDAVSWAQNHLPWGPL